MKETATWVIIDTTKNKALYGVGGKTLAFTTNEIANEVACQFFNNPEQYLIVQIPDLNNQTK